MAHTSLIGTAHSGLEALLAAAVTAASAKTAAQAKAGSGGDFLASLLAAKGGSADGMATSNTVVLPGQAPTQKPKVATQDVSAALEKTPASTAAPVPAVPARSLPVLVANAGDVAAKTTAAAEAKKQTGKAVGDNGADLADAKTAAGIASASTAPGSQLQTQIVAVTPVVPLVQTVHAPVPAASGKAGMRAGSGSAKPTTMATPSFGAASAASADDAAGAVASAAATTGAAVVATGASSMVAHLAAAVGGPASGATEGTAPVVPAWVGAAPSLHGSVERHGGSGLNASDAASSSAADVADAGSAAYAGGGFGAPHTLVSTPQVLEVGMTGGAHGWLRVRAELGQAGEVTASLVASNIGSAHSLDKQLGAMSAYLKSESVGVTSLAVTAPEKGAGVDVSAGLSQGAAGSSAGQQQRQQQENAATFNGFGADGSVLNDSSAATVAIASPSLGDTPTAMLSQGSGGWLDVRV